MATASALFVKDMKNRQATGRGRGVARETEMVVESEEVGVYGRCVGKTGSVRAVTVRGVVGVSRARGAGRPADHTR